MKILVIEDELLIQKSLQKMLERRGAVVIATGSGVHAIQLIANNQFDRIICDLMLQDISGFDIIEESKRIYDLKTIGKLFIIITAYSSPQILNEAEKYGCTILSKPFDNLTKAIDLFLGEKNDS